MNIFDILIILFLVAAVVFSSYILVQNKRRGKTFCGGNCAGCAGCANQDHIADR